MICPNCLEEYNFVKFDLHPESLEPRAIFRCICERPVIFPARDSLNLEMLNEELQEQLRCFKLIALRQALDRERKPAPLPSQAMPIRVRHLERYLSEISLKSIEPVRPAHPVSAPPPNKK